MARKSGTDAPKVVTLGEIHDGAALEMWQQAFDQVLANIDDPNTDAKSKRLIRLDFVFTTNDERGVADVEIKCSTKLAGLRGAETLLYIGRHEGALVAVEQPRQEALFPTPGGDVVRMVPGGKDGD